MAAAFLHGVETIELVKGSRPIRVVKSAVIALIGIAPLNPSTGPAAGLQGPFLVTSKTKAAEFGEDIPGFTIPKALNSIFAQGAGTVLVVNVYDSATHLVEESGEDVGAIADGKLALDYAPVQDLVLTSVAEGVMVLDTDYSVDAFGNITILDRVTYPDATNDITATYKRLDASTVTASHITGAIDGGTGERTGLEAYDIAYSLYGFKPKIFICPVFAEGVTYSAPLIAKAEALKGHAILDAPSGTIFDDAIAGRGPAGTINFYTSSKRAVLLWPQLKAYDEATDAEAVVPYSSFYAGVVAKTDNDLGYWHSPSNKEILGITGIETPVTAAVNDATTEANQLNEQGITTVFNSFGSGYRVWGNRSAAYPSNTLPDNFVSVRRTADILHESVELAMLQFIDLPINQAVIDSIRDSVNAFLRTLVGRGAIIDGICEYDPDKNPDTEIAAGHLTFDITFMPPPPLERMTFESFIDISILNQLT